ncbi:MAG: glycosyltransferase [Candidatus Eisenbacteria bacterium]|jgi:glycosyltransferase involved in cell wall biosynthesis|nr:glycosyltransferase [Candidatus Eisenbacteria bacterium]
MRILVVSPFVPYPPDRGHRVRIFWLMKQLALRHEVGLVTQWFSRSEHEAVRQLRDALPALDPVLAVQSPAHRSALSRAWFSASSRLAGATGFPRERIYHSSAAVRAVVDRALREWRPDLVQGEYWFSRWALPPGVSPVVWIDTIDLHWLRADRESTWAPTAWRRAALRRRARIIMRHELAAYGSVGRLLAVHEVEAEILRKRLEGIPVSLVPIACSIPPRPAARSPGNVVLFIGAMDYLPNRDAVCFLADEVMPLVRSRVPGASLRVVGRLPGTRGLPHQPWIQYTGHVADLGDAVTDVGAAAAPLRLGAGTSVKVLSILGLGLPLVASARAVEGLPLRPGVHFLAAGEAADTATAVAGLLASHEAGRALGRAGHGAALAEFHWRSAADRVLDAYEEGMVR